ncbi:hypothetical protein MGYG_07041 [Nannizzia gypsea CBS 118893]|uniref:Major facilitator superfamily (MFS) profile domain-containing protein n=1 Tax=Arthroderma gypseum (strain ATCC MYA-4604 / CBS 118893) TaxID=535722 RepID=E4V1X0_ARTGP|nr:hypothetical protein MGYG_07041 [Nannizzia gypsea CBS 118893]EFR04035.1 hypothetical protein MGYG_07041 [Nannizzia gypsea CBS 118893]
MDTSAQSSVPASGQASIYSIERPLTNTIPNSEKATVDDGHSSIPPRVHGWKWFLVCCVLYSSAFLYGLDTTIVADVQVPIVERFGSVDKLSWLGTGFPLGSVATILPIGALYNIFDIKYVYIISLALFEGGSALCGGAPSMDSLIVGRVMAGIGGCGMYLGVLNYIAIFTTLRRRPVYMGLTGIVWGAGAILGPVIGGSFADSPATWRWAFYINLVLAAVTLPALFLLVPRHNSSPDGSVLSKFKELDIIGMVLNGGIYFLWVMVLTFAGVTWKWNDGRIIALFVLFGVTLIVFILQQYFAVFTTPARRAFPGAFLRRRSLIILYISTCCSNSAFFVGAYYIPLFFQFTRGDSAIAAAVRLLPFVMVAITFIMSSGALMPVFGYYMPWYFISGVFLVAGSSLMYTVDAHTPTANIYGYSVLLAIGAGSIAQAAYSVAAAKVKGSEVNQAVTFINLAQLGAAVLCLAISGTIFQNLAIRNLEAALAQYGDYSRAQLISAIAGAKSDILIHGTPEVKEAAINAIIAAMKNVYVSLIAAGGTVLVTSLFLKREKLFMKMEAGG